MNKKDHFAYGQGKPKPRSPETKRLARQQWATMSAMDHGIVSTASLIVSVGR